VSVSMLLMTQLCLTHPLLGTLRSTFQ